MISLQWQHHIYGVSYPLLTSNKPFIEYGNIKWLNHFTQLLRKHNIHIKLKYFESPIPQRENDVCIMDIITKNIASKITLQRLNTGRLFLQIALLSKIAPRQWEVHQTQHIEEQTQLHYKYQNMAETKVT